MVDATVSKAISDLNSIIVHEDAMPFAFIEELRKLSLSFKHIRPVLEDAERRAVTDNSVLEWVLKLKDLAFEADDMMDEWRTAALSSIVQEREGVGSSNKVGNQSSCLHFSGMVFGNKIIKMIKKLRKDLDRIVDETTKHKYYAGRSNSTANSQVKLFSSPEESEIFGREEEKNEIINLLLKKSSRKSSDIPVVSIEGVRGLGKTTLAQLVYEDQGVKKQFDRRVWVRAYRRDHIRIMEIIYKTVNPNKDDINHLENLQLKLAEILRQTRNLFVFDDYMMEDSKMWETLKLVLKFSQKDSKILVISNDDKIEKLIQPTYKHQLKGLSSEDSWAVLSHKALRGRSSTEDCLELEKIGRKIVEKCQGVPLALKVAGGALQYMKSRSDWEHFLQSKTWETQVPQSKIPPALLLGYYSLSPQVRQCFEYCSITTSKFRSKDFYVRQWMAHGFLGGDGEKEMEQRGGEYFDELLGRSFFYEEKSDNKKATNRFKMHDLIHNLAGHTARGEVSVVYTKFANVKVSKARHYLFVGSDNIGSLLRSASESQSLRSLIVLPIGPTNISELFQHLRCLRLLDLSNSSITEVPSIIGSMKHLRYLDLSRTKIATLPMSVTDLCSLQTLRLNQCSLLCALPNRMDKLVSLRHLELEGTEILRNLPEKIRELSSLRTLSKFCISNDSGLCGIKDLEKFNHLQGFLSIQYLDLVTGGEDDVKLAKLHDKEHVTDLELYWRSEYSWKIENELHNVLENLRPHTNLQKLSISNYRGERFVNWMEDPSFSNLVKIKLHGSSCRQLPAMGKLPSLVSLHLKRMNEVQTLKEDLTGGKGGFQKLEKLTLWGMHTLTEWMPLTIEEGDVATMPCLRKLKVKYCPKLKELPCYFAETLTKLTISYCDKLTWRPSIRPVLERLVLDEPAGTLLMELPYLAKLKTLEIREGCTIKSLPKGLWKLRSLESLIIQDCLKLTSLPEDIQHLTALQQLTISRCSLLARECNIGGKEWQKIAFIPSIQIDEKNVHTEQAIQSRYKLEK